MVLGVPQVDLQTGRIVAAEALVRWQHPQRGLLGPHEFIPLAERVMLIEPLTQWVLNAALCENRAWQAAGRTVPVAVNVSMRSFQDPYLPEMITGLLARWEVAPSSLRLEMAQLLALWRPGAFSKSLEQAYLAARFGGQRPSYFHPSLGPVLDPTHGVLLYADQVPELLRLVGFEYQWADRFRRALATGRRAQRVDMERELKEAAQLRRWTEDQINALVALLQEHAGYLYAHGHALARYERYEQMAVEDRGGPEWPDAALPRTPCPDRHGIRVQALGPRGEHRASAVPPRLRFAGLDGPWRGYSKGVADGT